jgi:hypothetical protein
VYKKDQTVALVLSLSAGEDLSQNKKVIADCFNIVSAVFLTDEAACYHTQIPLFNISKD